MGEYRKERLLLEGQVKLIIDPMEFRMALWINGFGLSDAVTGEEIIPCAILITWSMRKKRGIGWK